MLFLVLPHSGPASRCSFQITGPCLPHTCSPFPLNNHTCVPAGLLWEVTADLASLGVSLVAPTREMAYLHAAGLRAEVAGTVAHLVVGLEMRTLQVTVARR